MSTKQENITNPDSCLGKAEADEPIFVLRAHDKSAPKIVRSWAKTFMEYHQKAGTSGRPLAAAILKYEDAMEVAAAMENWKDRKQAD